MIARRSLLGGLVAAAAIPRPTVAQRDGRPVLGVVFGATPVAEMTGPDRVAPSARALVQSLRDLGWIEGQNLIIEWRSAEGRRERAAPILAELVTRRVDVILVSAMWLVEAVRRTTTTVPVVAAFGFGQDPAALGLVASLARPGGNLTGVSVTTGVELARKRLQFLTELAPRTTRIAWLGTRLQQQLHPPDAGPAGTHIVFVVADEEQEFAQAFATIMREGADALHLGGTAVHYVARAQIVAFAAKHRLPAAYPYREAVDEGGLMAYGSNNVRTYQQMARQIDRILKGANPGDLPIELPDRFDFVIHRKTAQTLGLTIPPALLTAAEVID